MMEHNITWTEFRRVLQHNWSRRAPGWAAPRVMVCSRVADRRTRTNQSLGSSQEPARGSGWALDLLRIPTDHRTVRQVGCRCRPRWMGSCRSRWRAVA